jgi:hypothetical protein
MLSPSSCDGALLEALAVQASAWAGQSGCRRILPDHIELRTSRAGRCGSNYSRDSGYALASQSQRSLVQVKNVVAKAVPRCRF